MNASSVVLHTIFQNEFQLTRHPPNIIGRWKQKLLLSIVSLFSFSTQLNWALPGDLDATFGGTFGRYFINQEANEFDAAAAIARQADGKLVIAGTCGSGASADFCVLRRNVDGSADTAFGYAQGASRITPSNFADSAVGVALQSDGKIIVAGSCVAFNIRSFCMARLDRNGLLDTSFGNGGIVNQIVGAGDADPRAIAIEATGKILIGGSCFDGTFNTLCAARFLPSGAFDNSFGNQGRRFFPTSVEHKGYALAIQGDGKILIAGSCYAGISMCVGRFTASGDIDVDFGGIIGTDGGSDAAYAVAVQADKKIVLAGSCLLNGSPAFCATRLESTGSFDTEFGGVGASDRVVRYSLGSTNAVASALALQNDGRILLVGSCFGTTSDFCLLRLNDNGSADQSFGSFGVVKTNVIDAGDFGYATLIQPDGKIVVAGQCAESSAPADAAMCIARYEGGPFGARNCSFDVDGDGVVLATTDQLILSRIARGVNTSAAVSSIDFAPHATRKTWSDIRTYLVAQCGVALP